VRQRQADVVSVVQEGLESMRVVQAFGQEALEETKVGGASVATLNASLKARRVKAVLSPVVNIAVALCTTIVLWRGAVLILQDRMTAGALIVFLAYLTRFFKPLQDLAKITNAFAQTTVAIERVEAVLDADTIIPEAQNSRDLSAVTGRIAFENVGFGYDPTTPILHDVSLQIQPGQRIGFVGPTGSGKSTLVSLIARFYDATAGRITLDEVDVRDYHLRSLRENIGFVLQDTALFQGTIRENIAFGRPSATQQEIEKAAELANASEFIHRMPAGYDSVVGERGATLSGGQRQRIGIARAIVRNSPVLILDEPTAALDAESEKLVMEAMERLMEGRTVIIIAHRLSTIRDADQIVVLKNGAIVEHGRHEELLHAGGMYAQLYGLQTDDKLAAASGQSTASNNQSEAACPVL
jgi:ABC-type multidrug transport system fused ATPase/permease subunit